MLNPHKYSKIFHLKFLICSVIVVLGTSISGLNSVWAQNTKGAGVSGGTEVKKEVGNTYALIVGVSKYKNDKTYPSLNFADDDARAFYNFLRSEDGGAIPDENIDTLIDENATQMSIWGSLGTISDLINPGDRLYIFFSGHGDAYRSDQAFLLPHDAPAGKGKGDKNHYLIGIGVINVGSLKVKLSELMDDKDVEVVLITDACRTGEIPGGDEGKRNAYEAIFEKKYGEVQIISCSSDQVSREGKKWGNGRGLFSYYLINGLSGHADVMPPDGKVTLFELSDYTKRHVQNESYIPSQERFEQTPIFCCSEKNAMVMSRAKSEEGYAAVLNHNKESTLGSPNSTLNYGLMASKGVNAINDTKGVDLKSLMRKAGHYSDYRLYMTAVNKDNLIGENGALEVVESLISKGIDDKIEKRLKLDFSSRLGQSVADVLNAYIQSSINNSIYSTSYFESAYKELLAFKKYANPYYYSDKDITVNLLFLKAHSLWYMHRTYELREALVMVDSAIGLEPEAAYLHNLQGMLNRSIGNHKKADKAFKTGINLAPNWVYPTHNLGINYLERKQLDSAYTYLKLALKLDTNYSTTYLGMSRVKQSQNDADSAEWYCLKGLRKNNHNDLWLWNQLGDLYLEKGKYEDASRCYHRAKSLDTTEYVSYLNLINYHVTTVYNIGDSLPYYINKMIDTDSLDPLVYFALGNALAANDLDSMALDEYAAALSLDSANARIWDKTAQIYRRQGKKYNAISSYEKVATLENENAQVWYEMGKIYFEDNKLSAAIFSLENGVHRSPNNAILLDYLGILYTTAEDFKQAERVLLKAIDADPDFGRAHFDLAKAYAAKNSTKKRAVRQLEIAVLKDPSIDKRAIEEEPLFNSIRGNKNYKRLLRGLQ
jgi:predicted Zn-dependent protease